MVYKWFIDENDNWLGQYIWIKDNKVLATTSGRDVNADNIDLVLQAKYVCQQKWEKPVEEKKFPE